MNCSESDRSTDKYTLKSGRLKKLITDKKVRQILARDPNVTCKILAEELETSNLMHTIEVLR